MDGETAVFLDRSSRATRGKRMLKLIDDEAEADEQFWGQSAFKDEAEDIEYEAEDEDVDEFDSDFDEDENNVEDEAPEEDDERFRVKKKKLFPPGTKLSKDKKRISAAKTKGLAFIEAAVAAAMDSNDDSKPNAISVPAKQSDETIILIENSLDLEGERSVRKSTRTAVVVRQAERDALRVAMQATIKPPVKKKREGDEKRITQEDMLLEAAQTEIMNRQSLEKMLAREEEVKQKAIVHKTVYDGPQIRFYSRDGKNLLEFMKGVAVAEELFRQPKPDRRPLECAVTGLPAKYIDPLTGLPYATKEAFRKIRERVDREDKFIQKKILETPWKRARSGRSMSSHANVTRARSYKLNAASFGSSSLLSTGTETVPVGFDEKEKIVRSHLPERSSSQDVNSETIAKGMEFSFQTLSTCTILTEERSGETVVQSGPSQVEGLGDHHLALGLDASVPSLFDNLKMPLWVEIPPPKEEPIDDEYILDELTSLKFGPILSLQHGVGGQDLRGLEDDIEKSPAEALLHFDVLPMPDLSQHEFH